MAVKHSLVIVNDGIKRFASKEEYQVQKIKPTNFQVSRNLKDRTANIKIYYNQSYYYGNVAYPKGQTIQSKYIKGADLEVYKEAKKYLSPSENTMLQLSWDKARQSDYMESAYHYNLSEYDTSEPSELLANALENKDLSVKEVTKDDYSTMYKVLKGSTKEGRELTRAKAIEYAKAIGCDPASLMFNKLKVPLWGTVDIAEEKTIKEKKHKDELGVEELVEKSYRPGQIAVSTKVESVICPRDLYLPTVKAIAIKSKESIYDGMIAYYYHTNKISDEAINKLCVVGYHIDSSFTIGKTKIGVKEDRYFFGIYRIYGTRKKLFNPDPNISEKDPRHIILDDFTPSFVAPIVSLAKADALENRDVIPVQKLQTVGQLIRQEELNKINTSKFISDHLTREFYKDRLKSAVEKKVDSIKGVKEANKTMKLAEASKDIAKQMTKLFEKQTAFKEILDRHLHKAETEIEKSKKFTAADLVVDDKIYEFKRIQKNKRA